MPTTKNQKFDFSGYATKSGVKCSDGRTIMPNAFRDMDGQTVPLVWQHDHQDMSNVLGHAVLENRPDGVYAYATLNHSPAADNARELIQHGDIKAFSIFANQLTQSPRGEVQHGTIRELSLVLSGANPEATIDNVQLQHSDGSLEEIPGEAVMYFDEELDLRHGELIDENQSEEDTTKPQFAGQGDYLNHADPAPSTNTSSASSAPSGDSGSANTSKEPTIQDILDTFNPQQMQLLQAVVGSIMSGDAGDSDDVSHAGDDPDPSDQSDDDDTADFDPQEVYDSLNEQQKTVFDYIVAQAQEDAKKQGTQNPPSNNQNGSKSSGSAASTEGDSDMGAEVQHNAFDTEAMSSDALHDANGVLKHDVFDSIWHDALTDRNFNSMKESVMAHADGYGITNIEDLFPDPKTVNPNGPSFIKRDDTWVDSFISGLDVRPFARIKSQWADITEDAARAKGYTKGHKKIEEVIKVGKRTTDPVTVYKKQKLDRDDILDITDFDVVAYLKNEMKGMLQEEIARAVLVGDGREAVDNDKIDESHIRPVYTDDELYTIHYQRTIDQFGESAADDKTKGDTLVESVRRAMDDYLGKGTPKLYAASGVITDLLMLKDKTGRPLYNDDTALANRMGVSEIVRVPVLKGIKRTVDGKDYNLDCIILNPSDYKVGRNSGGETTMFDDFDIDYNQYKYLMETRMSGALVDPKTAVVVESIEAPKA